MKDTAIILPLGGNTWLSKGCCDAQLISEKGIVTWKAKENVFSTFFRVDKPGTVHLQVNGKADKKCCLSLRINHQSHKIWIHGSQFQWYDAGNWQIKDSGYLSIELSCLVKSPLDTLSVRDYSLSGTAINDQTALVSTNEGNFFYWGRRGPSVHLSYPFSDSIRAAWFYSELTVPAHMDVVGSYFMTDGFGEGYFGMQVNSQTERRILFSVWSPFSTDDPKLIPRDSRIVLLRKGPGVETGAFGSEGSGGQSFLKYPWRPGTTYKFLIHGQPDGSGNTTYTAYFFAPEKKQWLLIASFKRPKTNTYLRHLYSFLENFLPEQGNKTREAFYSNQWICDSAGHWTQLDRAIFTYDQTAAKGYRKDYAGGVKDDQLFLENGGFFNHYTPYGSRFQREPGASPPGIDFRSLP